MAGKEERCPENARGKFYVDSSCIDCDICKDKAPLNFKRDDAKGYAFVFKQPANPEEEASCKAVMEECPVEAIGDDGEEISRNSKRKA